MNIANIKRYAMRRINLKPMAQQTAVEWLIEQLVELDKQLDGKRKSDDSTVIKFNPTKIYEQAKQIEKEQIEGAYIKGGVFQFDKDKEAEQYYNETYQNK